MSLRAVAGCAVLVVSLGGCSVDVETYGIASKESIEKKVAESLAPEFGRRPESVECPGDLKGRKGESVRCTMILADVRQGVTVTVTSAKGLAFETHVETDDRPLAVAEEALEKGVPTLLEKDTGLHADKVECPGDLPAGIGKSIRCSYTSGDGSGAMSVTVTKIEGHTVRYHVLLDVLPKAAVEKKVADALERKTGQLPAVECPGQLTSRAGETIRCNVTQGAGRTGATLSVKAAGGGKLDFDVTLDDPL